MNRFMKIVGILMALCLLVVPFMSAAGEVGDVIQHSGPVYILGDSDDDGEVSIIDATYIQRYLAHFDFNKMALPGGIDPDTFIEGMLIRGDVDNNEDIESIDATYIMRYEVHIRTPYPIGEEFAYPVEPTEAPTTVPTEAVTEVPTQVPTQAPTAKPDPYELPPI